MSNTAEGFYVPGPAGGLIHTTDPEVAQVAIEEQGDDWDDYDPRTHDTRTCWRDAGRCPGCRDEI
ncbi:MULTISPECIES: hypothetical protein [unclassified Lentzea]|uniref:hypothetical protein n=1 Tax=unclassified Lentzea TaxID=2643253 RepID=UPI0038067CF4